MSAENQAKYKGGDIVEIEDHKVEGKDIHYHCTVKGDRRGAREKVWINSADPEQVHPAALGRANAFKSYYVKNGHSDRGSFERAVIIESGKGMQHYLFTANVFLNDDMEKKAVITINKNYPTSILGSKSGIPLCDVVEATIKSQVFPPRQVRSILLCYIINENGGRKLQQEVISSKYIKMQPSEKQSNRKGKKGKKVALPYRPGNVCDIIFYSREFAAEAGYLDDEDVAECKNEEDVKIVPKKEKLKNKVDDVLTQHHMTAEQAAAYLLGAKDITMIEDIPVSNSIDLSATNVHDAAENDSGSYSSSFVSKNQEEQHPNAPYSPTASLSLSSCSDEEPKNKYELLKQENACLKDKVERYKRKYERERRKNEELQRRLYKLEQKCQDRKRKEKERNRKRRRSRKRERNSKRYRRKTRYSSGSDSDSSSSQSSSTSSYSKKYKHKSKSNYKRKSKNKSKRKKDGTGSNEKRGQYVNSDGQQDQVMKDNAASSLYKRNTVERLIRVHENWKRADAEGVPVGHYALHPDQSNNVPAACESSTELWKTRCALKYCEKFQITIKRSDAKVTLKKWCENNQVNFTDIVSMGKICLDQDKNCPADWLIVD